MTQGYANRQTQAGQNVQFNDMCKMASGEVTITAGGGDVTITLLNDMTWEGGWLTVVGSSSPSFWSSVSNTSHFWVSYDGLTNGDYTTLQIIEWYNNTITQANKTDNVAGTPKSATKNSFTLDDDGANTRYIKWFVWAPYTASITIGTDQETGYDTEGAYRFVAINGTKTKVYTKYLIGITDADTQTNVTHGIADEDKILSVSWSVASSAGGYLTGDNRTAVDTNVQYGMSYGGGDLVIYSVGTNMQSQNYRIKIEYYL